MFGYTILQMAALAASGFLLGMAKTGVPGAAAVAIPLAASVISARESTGIIVPLLLVGDVFAVAWYHRHAMWNHLIRLLPYTVIGILAGYLVLGRIDDRILRPAIGWITLGLLALQAWWNHGRPEAPPQSRAFSIFMGFLAGLTTMMANGGGPIMSIYLLTMRLPKDAFIGTAAWYFMIVNLIKVPFSLNLGLITPASLALNVTLSPSVLLGAVAGIGLARRMPEHIFNRIIQLLAIAGSVRLLF